MAVVGYLGKSASEGVIFEVSEQTVRTLKNWKWSGSVRYAVHNRHNYHALTEYTGMDPDKITFDIILKAELGVKPLDDIVKIWTYEREGIALALTVGRKGYGKYRWNIVNHSTDFKHTDVAGNPTEAVVSLTLQEDLRR